jgi:hypothetical protein
LSNSKLEIVWLIATVMESCIVERVLTFPKIYSILFRDSVLLDLLPVHGLNVIKCLLKGIEIMDLISSRHILQLVDPLVNW